MKRHLIIIIWLFSINCNGHDDESQKKDMKESIFERTDYHKEYIGKNNTLRDDYQTYDYKYDEEYIGNPDFDAMIERPCLVYDLNCIRKYFAEHSKCKIRRGPLPRTLFMSQETVYYTLVNTSAVLNNFVVDGFRNTRIEEFYINRRTNKIVFSIQVRFFMNILPLVYFNIYRNGREPIVVPTDGFDFFPSVTYTAIIPYIDGNIQLKKAEITPYADSVPGFYIGPEVLSNPDPTVILAITEFLANVPIVTQERLLTNSYTLLPAYIQLNICDFGLSQTISS